MKFSITASNLALGIQNTCIALISGVSPDAKDPTKLDCLCEEAFATIMQADLAKLEAHPYVEEFRAIYRRLGYNPKRLALPAYSFFRLVQKRQVFPRISAAVDAYNCAVAHHFIAIGAHDADSIVGDVRFMQATGSEPFLPVGSDSPMPVKPGDFLYRDDSRVLALLASRDCDEAKLTQETRNILLVSEANTSVTAEVVRTAVTEACENIVRVCGGSYELKELEQMP
jgi:DNA/RNA-binding domain of Phe-tRNA-synthetase-like protein